MTSRKDAVETAKNVVEIVAVVLGGLWVFGTYVYQEQIAPSYRPASLTIAAQITDVTAAHAVEYPGGLTCAHVRVSVHNTGLTEVRVLGGSLSVYGFRVRLPQDSGEAPPADWMSTRVSRAAEHAEKPAGRYYRYSDDELVFWQQVYRFPSDNDDGLLLAPDEAVVSEFLVYVPSGVFDELQAVTEVLAVRSSGSEDVSMSWISEEASARPAYFRSGVAIDVSELPAYLESFGYSRFQAVAQAVLWRSLAAEPARDLDAEGPRPTDATVHDLAGPN